MRLATMQPGSEQKLKKIPTKFKESSVNPVKLPLSERGPRLLDIGIEFRTICSRPIEVCVFQKSAIIVHSDSVR